MTLSREAYQALEDIVGRDNISEEPATLDSYAFQWHAEYREDDPSHFMPRPGAAVLPGSTEEVQAIVKTCNRYKLKFKAHSSGWHMMGAPRFKDGVQIDLRRMDRILEIDDKNNFAVIEPYVIGATLQAEAMKLGLNTHMIGAGASCSPLAAATSFSGAGADSIFMGTSPENLLAAEWVMPNGDILRTGSLGAGLGWFCGDGPGPSLHGVFRGVVGAYGGLGVFTKCALKLYPWPGPSVMPIEGTVPAYTTPVSDSDVVRGHTISWPTWQGYADACYKIFNNDIGYIAHRQYIKFGDELQGAVLKVLTDPTKTKSDLEELLKDPEIQKLSEELWRAFQIVLAGMTPRDIQYQEKVLDLILAETGGWKVAAMEKPPMVGWSLLYLIKLCFKNLNYFYAGGYSDAMMVGGTPDVITSGALDKMREQQRKFAKEGGIVDHGGDAGMGGMAGMGGGGYPGFENFVLYDSSDPESIKATRECLYDAVNVSAESGIKLGISGTMPMQTRYMTRDEQRTKAASVTNPRIYGYQRMIKEALDPNDTGEGSWLYLKEQEIGKNIGKNKGR
jgi:glycolate oxidase